MDRYLIRGFVDGLLSTLGVVIGASTAIGGVEMEASRVIIAAGVSGGVANGISNILGAIMGEKAATYKRFKKVEKAMLKEEALRNTKMDERVQDKIRSSGIIDGISTIFGALIPVAPFLLVSVTNLTVELTLYISIITSLVVFFFLGGYIGKISKENVLISGLKMAAFGGATAVIATLIRMSL